MCDRGEMKSQGVYQSTKSIEVVWDKPNPSLDNVKTLTVENSECTDLIEFQ